MPHSDNAEPSVPSQRPRQTPTAMAADALLDRLATTAFPRQGAPYDTRIGAGAGTPSSSAVPLNQALEQAAHTLGVRIVNSRRTGPRSASVLVGHRGQFHKLDASAEHGQDREDIDDQLYAKLVQLMRHLQNI